MWEYQDWSLRRLGKVVGVAVQRVPDDDEAVDAEAQRHGAFHGALQAVAGLARGRRRGRGPGRRVAAIGP